MTDGEARAKAVEHWLRKAEQALASADAEFTAGRYDFAANRAYYAAFYAASAVLLQAGRKFVKHSGVRAAVHQELVKSGRLDSQWGKGFDRAFEIRQAADYLELREVERAQAEELLSFARSFVAEMKRLLGSP